MGKANKLYSLAGKAPQFAQRADDFWPLPDTYIGIEMEIEGLRNTSISWEGLGPYWKEVGDPSLRDGTELIFPNPFYGSNLRAAISAFFNSVKGYKISTRTSTHIHINMMGEEDDVDTLRNTIALYCAAEDHFYNVVGEDRRWSGYCSPMSEAPVDILGAVVRVPFNPDHLANEFKKPRRDHNNPERYYALNLLSLGKHGTLEFRHFQCATKEEELIEWVKMVMLLKKAAMLMGKDGVDGLVVLADADKVRDCIWKYLPEMADNILNTCATHKIASKVAAIAAHAVAYTQEHRIEYTVREAGEDLFSAWCKKKGLLDKDQMLKKQAPSIKLSSNAKIDWGRVDRLAGYGANPPPPNPGEVFYVDDLGQLANRPPPVPPEPLRPYPPNVQEYPAGHKYRKALREEAIRGKQHACYALSAIDVELIAIQYGFGFQQCRDILSRGSGVDIRDIADRAEVEGEVDAAAEPVGQNPQPF